MRGFRSYIDSSKIHILYQAKTLLLFQMYLCILTVTNGSIDLWVDNTAPDLSNLALQTKPREQRTSWIWLNIYNLALQKVNES
jgi:hypothetical protein